MGRRSGASPSHLGHVGEGGTASGPWPEAASEWGYPRESAQGREDDPIEGSRPTSEVMGAGG